MGTFAAGVHKLTEIVPHIVEEVLLTIPDNQKDKLRKLIDIWESAGTFQRAVLADFRKKLDSPGKDGRSVFHARCTVDAATNSSL